MLVCHISALALCYSVREHCCPELDKSTPCLHAHDFRPSPSGTRSTVTSACQHSRSLSLTMASNTQSTTNDIIAFDAQHSSDATMFSSQLIIVHSPRLQQTETSTTDLLSTSDRYSDHASVSTKLSPMVIVFSNHLSGISVYELNWLIVV